MHHSNPRQTYLLHFIAATIVLLLAASVSFGQLKKDSTVRGSKQYELTNHLGNVLATVSDRRLQTATPPTGTSGVTGDLLSATDYYAFGMLMPGRNYSGGDYRFGYDGMEKDDEVKESGNSYTTEFRQHDSRLGKWVTIDPLARKFPNMGPYIAFDDNPVSYNDPSGLEAIKPGPGGKRLHIGRLNISLTIAKHRWLSKRMHKSPISLKIWLDPKRPSKQRKGHWEEEETTSEGMATFRVNNIKRGGMDLANGNTSRIINERNLNVGNFTDNFGTTAKDYGRGIRDSKISDITLSNITLNIQPSDMQATNTTTIANGIFSTTSTGGLTTIPNTIFDLTTVFNASTVQTNAGAFFDQCHGYSGSFTMSFTVTRIRRKWVVDN